MKLFLKIITSIPVILIVLYFIPVLGVALVIMRIFVRLGKRVLDLPITLLSIGLIGYIPEIIRKVLNILNKSLDSIPYLDNILKSEVYKDILDYAKLLLILGIILLIISLVMRLIMKILGSKMTNFIKEELQKEEIIKKDSYMLNAKMQTEARNNEVIICPYCGASNILSKNGKCKYCRRDLKKKDN